MNYRSNQVSVIRFHVFMLLCLAFAISPSKAQETSHTAWEVYVERDIDANGTDRISFLDLLIGDITSAEVVGERFTLLDDYLLYFDLSNRAVMTIRPDGTVSPHPFIRLQDARRADWLISSDNRLIAWTLTYGEANSLSTVTSIANPSGTNQRVVLSDGPRNDGVRVFPVAFSVDNSALILDSQPDGIGDLIPYRQYASLFRLSLIDGEITSLPDEASCFCAAALRAGQFLRLSATTRGFAVRVYDLENGESQTITTLGLVNYTLGGDILISPDGNMAVYALSQVEIGTTPLIVRTVLILINLQSMTQIQLSEPISSYIHPVKWTEDRSAILLTIPERNGTWKINLDTGELVRVAEATFIGVLED
jgi:hypothetical protein